MRGLNGEASAQPWAWNRERSGSGDTKTRDMDQQRGVAAKLIQTGIKCGPAAVRAYSRIAKVAREPKRADTALKGVRTGVFLEGMLFWKILVT